MKTLKILLALSVSTLLIMNCSKNHNSNNDTGSLNFVSESGILPSGSNGNGNGAPSGPHYNLNIIGVPRSKTADMSGDNGHRIFVSLDGNTKIFLAPGDFQVIDANGTDANGATFQLPNPDSLNTGITNYSVWARPVGIPHGSVTVTTCATDVSTGDSVCSLQSYVGVRSPNQNNNQPPKFANVSKDLLYIYADLGNGVVRIPLFDDRLKDYYWSYDNNGLKVLQLRFYQIPTNVN